MSSAEQALFVSDTSDKRNDLVSQNSDGDQDGGEDRGQEVMTMSDAVASR